MNKICLQCGKRFEKKWNYSRKYFSKQKYCSRKCMGDAYKRLGIGNHLLGKWSSEHKGILSGNWKGGFNKKEWRKKNPEKERLYHRRYREKNFEKANQYSSEYKKKHRARYTFLENQRRMKIKKVGGTFTYEQWEDLCRKANYRCVLCKEKRKLTIDHIIPISKGGDNNITNIQPLCLKCNIRKNNN